MLVYGDREATVSPRAVLESLDRRHAAVARMPPGFERHAAAVSLLIAAGELAQGLADFDFAANGEDALSPASAAALKSAVLLARFVWRSHAGRYGEPRDFPGGTFAGFRRIALPDEITVRAPEGFAFYALYPESFGEAARALFSEAPFLVGIRSIGATVAPVAAAASGGAAPFTIRPFGPPFSRRTAISAHLRRIIAGQARKRPFGIVDEGPGRSGSSFASAAELVESAGVPAASVRFLPGHSGAPGPNATEEVRSRWEATPKRSVSFEELFPRGSERGVERWAADLSGAPEKGADDIGGGRWRERLFDDPDEWPPSFVDQERRKFLYPAGGRLWLAKFAGLGASGERKLTLAATLASGGWIPPEGALRHGFLFRPWIEGRPLDPSRIDRAALVDHVARYLAFRARRCPAERSDGAPPSVLARMLEVNAAEALGPEIALRARAFGSRISDLEAAARPVETDGRLQAWEWLVLSGGRLLKCDALDHSAAHDLVGCQDPAWDVAGAETELSLTLRETATVARRIERESGAAAIGERLPFYRAAYLAFQLGRNRLAARAVAARFPAEAARLEAAAGSYAALLADSLLRLSS